MHSTMEWLEILLSGQFYVHVCQQELNRSCSSRVLLPEGRHKDRQIDIIDLSYDTNNSWTLYTDGVNTKYSYYISFLNKFNSDTVLFIEVIFIFYV